MLRLPLFWDKLCIPMEPSCRSLNCLVFYSLSCCFRMSSVAILLVIILYFSTTVFTIHRIQTLFTVFLKLLGLFCSSYYYMISFLCPTGKHPSGQNLSFSVKFIMDGEVLELVWKNGNVITSSWNSRRTVPSFNEPNRYNASSSDIPLKCGGNLETCNGSIREDETVPWLQYLLDDSLGKDLCFGSSFGMPVNEVPNKPRKDKSTKFGCHKETNGTLDSMTSLVPVQQINGAVASQLDNSSQFSNSTRGDAGSTDEYCLGAKGVETASNNDVRQCSSTATKTSSNFCNNQVKSQPVLHNTLLRNVLLENITKKVGETTREEVHPSRLTSTCDITTTTTATTSSVASGSGIGRLVQQQSTSDHHKSHKRKARNVEESDYHSEEADHLSGKERKAPQRSASARRSRSSEVHNLSERRRRDRINEKMKALQELIPHCDKTDKASMLDEAIEYLKSLQLQVQIMWMGNGMAPVMLPNVQHYLSSLSMGMGHRSVSTLAGSLSMPRSMIDPLMSSANVTNQTAAALAHSALLQNANVPDAYAHYLRFNHIQPPLEVPNFFTPYSSPFQRVPTVGSNQASEGIGPWENTRHGS